MKQYKRECPNCGFEITYNYKQSFNKAKKLNSICKSCSSKERANRPDERLKNSLRQKGKRTGKDNPFYGKTHTKETKEIIRESRKNQVMPKGIDNPLYGKKLEDIVGIEKAKKIKLKKSIQYQGRGNPMYGKPSPMGSGNGWSGWYNGWFFRSILELSYMIKVIDRYNIKWESGETDKYKITYTDYNGTIRNYFPDFIINGKYMIEIKPSRLQNSVNVKSKSMAGIEYCNKNNMKFKITNVPPLTDDEIKELVKSNKIVLTDRYKKLYEEKYID